MGKVFNLKDLIDRIDWVALHGGRMANRLPDDAIGVSYVNLKSKEQRKNNVASHVKIRFGKGVQAAMDWKLKDKIYTMYDPDDVFSLLLIKKEDAGRSLTPESNSSSMSISFPWIHDRFPLKTSPSMVVPHEIYKGYLHLRLPSDDES